MSTTGVASLTSTELQINPTTGLISVYTANSATVGTHFVTVTASLQNYPTIPQATATFEIKVEPCIVTSYTMSSLSPIYD